MFNLDFGGWAIVAIFAIVFALLFMKIYQVAKSGSGNISPAAGRRHIVICGGILSLSVIGLVATAPWSSAPVVIGVSMLASALMRVMLVSSK